MRKPHYIILTLLLCMFSISSIAAITEKQASNVATKKHPGKVLEIKKQNLSGKPVYRVKIMDKKSVVRNVYIDINKGNIVKKKK